MKDVGLLQLGNDTSFRGSHCFRPDRIVFWRRGLVGSRRKAVIGELLVRSCEYVETIGGSSNGGSSRKVGGKFIWILALCLAGQRRSKHKQHSESGGQILHDRFSLSILEKTV